jgi:tight adherence protein B
MMLLAGLFFVVVAVVLLAALAAYERFGGLPQTATADSRTNPGEWFAPPLLRDESLSTISLWQKILDRVDGIEGMRSALEQAGLRWTVGRLTAMMLLAGSAVLAIGWRLKWMPLSVALALALAATMAPYAAVARRRAKRLMLIEKSFPDALDSLARSLRAGNPLLGALDLLAQEGQQPLAGEFRRLVDERNLGRDWSEALGNFAARIPLMEARVFAAAVLLHSRAGGRLNEVMASLAETMREAAALRGEVRSIAAQGKATGKLLTVLPLVVAVMMAYLNPAALVLLWNDPVGNTLLWLSASCLVLAWVVIRRMVEAR